MITAVDANVLIDLSVEDPSRAKPAVEALEGCASEGRLVVCEIVLAEFARGFPAGLDPAGWVRDAGIDYDPIREETAVEAGRMQARHEDRTDRRARRLIADLLVGAHALLQADRLLTRDRGFYRAYFRGLKVIEPA
jgi:predicted nucleic acid-binding protein